MNVNELLFDRIISLIFKDPEEGHVTLRLTQVKDGNLSTGAEGEAVTDAVGATITTLYNAKTAQITGTNALFSLDLSATQFGSKKEIASENDTIAVPYEEILTATNGTFKLSKTPIDGSVKYVYKFNNGLADKLTLATGATPTEGQFTLSNGTVTLPAGSTGKYYIEYEYASSTANKVVNNANDFPEVSIVKVKCLFRDPCNKNNKYGGWIVSERAEIDPSQVEIGLSKTGGHPFTVNMNKNYCDDDNDGLFAIIVDTE